MTARYDRGCTRSVRFSAAASVLALCLQSLPISGALATQPAAADTQPDITTIAAKPGNTTILENQFIRLETRRTPGAYILRATTHSGAITETKLANTPWDIRWVKEAADNKIVVDQPPSGDDDRIYILDGHTGAMVENFICEQPSLSPNGRYLAFIAFFTTHVMEESLANNFVMAYRFDRTTAENRNESRIDFPFANARDREVGLQLFPRSRPASKASVSGVDLGPLYSVASNFVWSPDSSWLLFVDEQTPGEPPAKGALNMGNVGDPSRLPVEPSNLLVAVDLRGDKPKVSTLPAPDCPPISGMLCDIDLDHAVFGRNGATVPTSAGSPITSRGVVQLEFARFRPVRG